MPQVQTKDSHMKKFFTLTLFIAFLLVQYTTLHHAYCDHHHNDNEQCELCHFNHTMPSANVADDIKIVSPEYKTEFQISLSETTHHNLTLSAYNSQAPPQA
jgi:hypothetical protein